MSLTESPTAHPSLDQLRNFNLGRLGDDEALSLGEHLERCAVCCQALRELPKQDNFVAQLKKAADSGGGGPLPGQAAPPQLGDYRIVREVGRGGMGVVYEAEQLSLGRRVAVKVLPARNLTEADALERFRRESRVAARLHHTNIVPVYEVGQEGDVCFYAMQLILGRSLDRLIGELRGAARSTDETGWLPQSRGAPPGGMASDTTGSATEAFKLPGTGTPRSADDTAAPPRPAPQEVARMGLQVAEALAYAHQRGVLHRDVKPANLLLDDTGTVWVTDFGLAKAEEKDLTRTGAVVGTLRYMAPERFGGECDPRADVYGLGCTLYELLALRPAFDSTSVAEIMREVVEREPPPLHSLNRSVPRDLETIIRKAMDRDRERRYQSAQDLADDLRRFLGGLPTRARPPGPVEHLARWARRHTALAAALAVIVLLVLAGLAGLGLATAVFYNQAEAQRKLAGEKEAESAKAREANEAASQALHKAETTLTDLYASHGLLAGERGDAPRAMLWFANAARLAAQDPDRARINRVRVRTWARQATLPVAAFGHRGQNLRMMAFRPGAGDLLLTVTESGHYRVWDWAREEPLPWANGSQTVATACWSPDGLWLALGLPGEVEVREISTGKLAQLVPRNGTVPALAFSPDSRFLAVTGGGLRIWDCEKKDFMGPAWLAPNTSIRSLAFSPGGEWLAVACADGRLRMFAVTEGGLENDKPLYEPVPHMPKGNGNPPAVFLNDGREFLTVAGDQELSWRAARTGQPVGPGTVSMRLKDVLAFVGSPDGRSFAVAGDNGAHGPQIWDATRPDADGLLCEHLNKTVSLAFSPDGRELLSVSWDRTAQRWSVPDGQPLGHPLPHQDTVLNAAYSPDGLHLATGQQHGLVRVWRRPRSDAEGWTSPIQQFAVRLKGSPGAAGDAGGRFVIPGKFGCQYYPPMLTPRLRVYQTASGEALGPAFTLGAGCADAAVSGDGRTAAAVGSQGPAGKLHVWDPRTGHQAFDPRPLPGVPAAVAFNADDSLLGVLCDNGEVSLFDPQTGAARLRFRLEGWKPGWPQILTLAFGSARGPVVLMHSDGSLRVHDETTGAPRCPPIRAPEPGGKCGFFRIAPDGQRLAVAWWGQSHAVQLFDLSSGQAVSPRPLPHPNTVYDICFTPDGGRVFTACRDGQARLWDWEAARLACPPCTHRDEVYGVAVTPDGLWGLTACRKGNESATGALHCWEFTTGKPAAPAVRIDGSVRSIALSPDGTRAVASVEGLGVHALSLTDLSAPAELGPDDLCTLAELAAGYRLYEGDLAGVAADEWLSLWRAFRPHHPDYGAPAVRAPDPRPQPDFEDLCLLADQHARRGEWKRAADALGQAVTLRPDDYWQSHRLAILLAETGDLDSYRRHCRAMLERFGDTQKPEVAERIAKACLLLPGVLDPEPAARLAVRALELAPMHEYLRWFHLAKGMAEYRQGRFESAITYLEKSRALNPSGQHVPLEALDLLFLAMACQRLGKADEAARWLDQARKYMDQKFPKPGGDQGGVWWDPVAARVVRREAEALFQRNPR
jgi:eukaryotic-like serine/threonine-protein kinase